MEFTTTLLINACRARLAGYASRIPVFADTEVGIHPPEGEHSQYTVRRIWKGMNGALRYGVLEVTGTMKHRVENKTDVTANLQLKAMGFVSIGLAILCFLIAFGDPRRSGFAIVVGLVLLGLLVLDWYILRRIIRELQS